LFSAQLTQDEAICLKGLKFIADTQPKIGLLPERLLSDQEERQCALQDDIEHGAAWRPGKIDNKRAAIDARLADLHQHEYALEADWVRQPTERGGDFPLLLRPCSSIHYLSPLLTEWVWCISD
jgi:hypothetical protein